MIDPNQDVVVFPDGCFDLVDEIIFERTLVLLGTGSTETVIRSMSGQRIFRLESGNDFVLRDLSLMEGFADLGGALYVESGSNVDVENVQFLNNQNSSLLV